MSFKSSNSFLNIWKYFSRRKYLPSITKKSKPFISMKTQCLICKIVGEIFAGGGGGGECNPQPRVVPRGLPQ